MTRATTQIEWRHELHLLFRCSVDLKCCGRGHLHCIGVSTALLCTMAAKTAAKRSRSGGATATGGEAEGSDSLLRRLVVSREHAMKFFEPEDGFLKTMDPLRSHNLRCVSPGSRFFIVECGHGRNSNDTLVFRAIGSVEFVENVSLTEAAVDALYDTHRCPPEAFLALRNSWKKKDVIVGWRVQNAVKFTSGMWFKPGSTDSQGTHSRLLNCMNDTSRGKDLRML